MMLEPEQKKNGVIAASAGNHALALAYHGGQLSKFYPLPILTEKNHKTIPRRTLNSLFIIWT